MASTRQAELFIQHYFPSLKFIGVSFEMVYPKLTAMKVLMDLAYPNQNFIENLAV
jgi:hypothetical protein